MIGIIFFGMIDFFGYMHQYLAVVGLFISMIGYGFVFDAALYVLKKDMELPEWKDWHRLFRQGLVLVAVFLMYLIPGAFVLYNSGILSTQQIDPLASLGGILLLLGFYLYPIAIFNFMIHRDIGRIVDFKFIFKKALSWSHLWAFILVLVYSSIIQWVAMQLNLQIDFWLFKAVIWGASAYLIGITSVTLFAIGYTRTKDD